MTTYRELWQKLLTVYDEGEAKAVVTWLMDVCFHLLLSDLIGGALERLTETDSQRLEQMMQRLAQGEPVQYVAGRTEFCGHWFHVEPGVLIPRPETEELCEWVGLPRPLPRRGEPGGFGVRSQLPSLGGVGGGSILDIGTGSGCIAISLALGMPEAQVTAWDISAEALRIASDNAKRLGANVSFKQQNALTPPQDTDCWDIIVSNPPYVCDNERQQMHSGVLDHEPHQALFVPNDDPLLFYRAIGQYASKALRRGGSLYFEINPLYHEPLCRLLKELGFSDITTKTDQFGKQRMVKGVKTASD